MDTILLWLFKRWNEFWCKHKKKYFCFRHGKLILRCWYCDKNLKFEERNK